MQEFYLLSTLAVPACTTVKAESLQAAIDIARDREVDVEPGDENEVWVAWEIQGATPEEIRKLGVHQAAAETPVVHVGGTGADRLFEDYTNAASAIRAALRELPEPNERDYPTRRPYSFEHASEDHQRWVAALQRVLDDLQTVLESIARQRGAAS